MAKVQPLLVVPPMQEECKLFTSLEDQYGEGSWEFVGDQLVYSMLNGKVLMSSPGQMNNGPMQSHVTKIIKALIDQGRPPHLCALLGIGGSLDAKDAPLGSVVIPKQVFKVDCSSISDMPKDTPPDLITQLQASSNACNTMLKGCSHPGVFTGVVTKLRPDAMIVDGVSRNNFITIASMSNDRQQKAAADLQEMRQGQPAALAADQAANFETLAKNTAKVEIHKDLACCDSVIKSEIVRENIRRHISSNLAAVGMEDYGFLEACKTFNLNGIIIRAMTDDCSANKEAYDKGEANALRYKDDCILLELCSLQILRPDGQEGGIRWLAVRNAGRLVLDYAKNIDKVKK